MKRIKHNKDTNYTIGIYEIRQLSTGKCYVGQSVNIERRHNNHLFHLRKGIHHCQALQQAWNSSTPEDFEHSVLETFTEKKAYDVEEQHYMDAVPAGFLFNSQLLSGGNATGYKHREETKGEMSKKARARNLDPDYNEMIRDRAKEQHSSGKLGRATWTEESYRKFNASPRRNILTRVFPDDEHREKKIEIQKNLKAFYIKWLEDGSMGYKAYATKLGVAFQVTRPFVQAFQRDEYSA